MVRGLTSKVKVTTHQSIGNWRWPRGDEMMVQDGEQERERWRDDDAVAISNRIDVSVALYFPATHLAVATANDVDEMAIVDCNVALDPDDQQPGTVSHWPVASPFVRPSVRPRPVWSRATHSAPRRHTSIALRSRLIINNLISSTVCAHIE